MVEHISVVKPDIISIDSPLSLPAGRCCGDKNCECAKHGIMRYCELTLKRFGIGVYPCLIDSMVNLTMRGINLASRLRGLGFNIIESYPGVAQDLLHIPRKRKGLELLLNGVKNFGIEGIRDDITHDEVDAITSALVGYFYLDNKYTSLGKKEEDYLIVPKLETNLSGKGIVIGLVGRSAAGKTTSAEYLRFRHGFTSMRFSKVIEEKYNVFGRDDLQRVGLEIANDPVKQKELSDSMINKMKEGENYVIDGLRQVIDYENLSSVLGSRFSLFYIESSFTIRAKRYCRDNLKMSRDEFIKKDEHPVETTIAKISNKSDYKVINNKGYKELMNTLDSLLLRLSK
jgi:predicted nuclease with RNAse H fold/dephospho-CoA kinase